MEIYVFSIGSGNGLAPKMSHFLAYLVQLEKVLDQRNQSLSKYSHFVTWVILSLKFPSAGPLSTQR